MAEAVFISGASGFLGKALVPALERAGYIVDAPSSAQLDLASKRPSTGRQYAAIIHLAAWTRAGSFCREFPGDQWIVNERMNLNLLDWWIQEQRQANLISFGTSVGYGGAEARKKEIDYLQGDPIEDYYGYSTSKRSLLYGQINARRQFGVDFTHLIPSTIYGPGYHMDGRQWHFVFDIMRKILRARYQDEQIELWGDGYQIRELIFIDDVVDVILRLLHQPQNDYINVSSGQGFTIRELAKLICEQVKVNPSAISYDENAFVGSKAKILDCEKLDRLFPDRKRTSLSDGLAKTIHWLKPEIMAEKRD